MTHMSKFSHSNDGVPTTMHIDFFFSRTPFQTTSNEAYNLVAPRNVGRVPEYETPQNLPPSTTSQPTTGAAEDSLYEPV